jgi:hypothetical protein
VSGNICYVLENVSNSLTIDSRANASAADPDLAEFNLDKYDEEIAADQDKSKGF